MKVSITGSVTITSFGTGAHLLRFIRFAAALTLTHNATSLILPNGGSNIVTAAGDTCIATSDGSGNWRVRDYQRADGSPINSTLAEGTWSPTFTPGSGSFTGHTITSNGFFYRREGNWLRCSMDFTLTNLGSGTPGGALTVSLPIAPAIRGFATGFEQAITAAELRGTHAATAALDITPSAGGTVIGTGKRIVFSNIGYKF
jgi:hypothetical protein